MTIALRSTASSLPARTEIFSDLANAEPSWRALERNGALMTAYQGFDVVARWQRHVGSTEGVTPMIVVSFDRHGAPLFLLPLGRRTVTGVRVGEFLGGKHANFNMGLWRRDALGTPPDDIKAALETCASHADALLLGCQPMAWNGVLNPMRPLESAPCASAGHSGTLQADFDALLRARTNSHARKKMRKKERALAAKGAVRFERAETAEDVRRILSAFLSQKRVRMRALGQPNVFGESAVQNFIGALATEPTPDGPPPAELYALSVDGNIIATFGGLARDRRFYGMFVSIAMGEYLATSPGEQLIVHVLRHLCVRGFTTFDLGTGKARYKDAFCPDEEPLFDSFMPLSAAGQLYIAAARLKLAAKRFVKASPTLWSVVMTARRMQSKINAS
jgi:CelD/BcsL family acetyltransferase involved in cellulose biosynthesis